jgi:Leucine rich repeat
MPIGILNLTNLTTLDLSQNAITKLPKALGRLKLFSLNLSGNKMGESRGTIDWSWLDGDNIRRSLSQINMSNNGLAFISSSLLKCSAITQIDLSSNEITRLPFSIKQAQTLKELNLSHNKLKSLPCTITRLHLSMIDLSCNLFPSDLHQAVLDGHREIRQFPFRISTLLELSSRTVMKHQIPFMSHNIPMILKEILFNSPFCSNSKCERMCFDMEIHNCISLIQLNSHRKVTSDNASHFPADGPFCSRKCAEVMNKRSQLR